MAGADSVTVGVPLGTGRNGNGSQGPATGASGLRQGPSVLESAVDRLNQATECCHRGSGERWTLRYSADAMHAKIQGMVVVSAVVLPDGSVTDVRVIRSLDRSFGLDMKAIEAARQWRFFPGTRQGEPVPVLVNIELEFNLR